MRKAIRQAITQCLWQTWRDQSSDMQKIELGLKKKGLASFALDHFAVIDLPSVRSGIPELCQLFTAIGYQERGRGYLAEKQNDFLWMAEEDNANSTAQQALPQIVVADFRLDELSPAIRAIIEKYASQTQASPLTEIKQLDSPKAIAERICAYLNTGRDWPLPTVSDFLTVHAVNELLAWVLVFGRKPNHFTISVHLLPGFSDLANFNDFIEQDVCLPLNTDGGLIKGSQASGIAQSSTKGMLRKIKLADGEVELPSDFTEFAWRYPVSTSKPVMWNDYFTDFVAQHADRVIESLYTE